MQFLKKCLIRIQYLIVQKNIAALRKTLQLTLNVIEFKKFFLVGALESYSIAMVPV